MTLLEEHDSGPCGIRDTSFLGKDRTYSMSEDKIVWFMAAVAI